MTKALNQNTKIILHMKFVCYVFIEMNNLKIHKHFRKKTVVFLNLIKREKESK